MAPTIAGVLAVMLGVGLQDAPAGVQPQTAGQSAETLVSLTLPQGATSLFQPDARSSYSGLFRSDVAHTVRILPRGRQAAPQQAPDVKIVCGLTVYQVDARLDPGMVWHAPSRGTKFAIRALTPPICRE